jgi:hypothetical protein
MPAPSTNPNPTETPGFRFTPPSAYESGSVLPGSSSGRERGDLIVVVERGGFALTDTGAAGADAMSGRTLFLLGLALFLLGFLLYGVTEDFTTSKVITVAGFWGGVFTMIAGGDRWWRERRARRKAQ